MSRRDIGVSVVIVFVVFAPFTLLAQPGRLPRIEDLLFAALLPFDEVVSTVNWCPNALF
jgi:hypothetical protein